MVTNHSNGANDANITLQDSFKIVNNVYFLRSQTGKRKMKQGILQLLNFEREDVFVMLVIPSRIFFFRYLSSNEIKFIPDRVFADQKNLNRL